MSAIAEPTSRPAPDTAAAAPGVLTLERVDGGQWDRIVPRFDEVNQEQLYVYAAARWPGAALEPVVFRRDGVIVGGCMMMMQPLPLKLATIAVCKWGPMLADSERPDARALRQQMVAALVAEYAVERRALLSILPWASTQVPNQAFADLMAQGFRTGSTLLFPNRYLVKLRLSDAEQRKSLAQKWRYHLNKAEKQGLSFERAEADQLPVFHALYLAMSDRKQFTDHSGYDTLPALMAVPDPALRPELFFVRQGGEIVAGAVIFKAGKRAVYLYGATDDRALPLRAGYFMHWHIIRWLRDETTADWYDLGGTDGFHGLHQFKKGMVGEAGLIRPVPPVANHATHWRPLMLGQGAFWLRDTLNMVRRRVDGWRNPRKRPDQAPHVDAGPTP